VIGTITDWLRIIDQRVRLGQVRQLDTGTIVERSTSDNNASVVFDGATVATPCKVFGWQRVEESDRVGLALLGKEWVVVGSYDDAGLGEASISALSVAMTKADATYADFESRATVTFTKRRDNTAVRVGIGFSCWSTAINSEADVGVNILGSDYAVTGHMINPASQHMAFYGARRITGLPAGTYPITMRWRRAEGTGTLTADANDRWLLEADEIRRSG
jgi:hypothetical protein